MRTKIEIDNDLMEKALKSGPYKTKKEAVTEGLKLLVERNNQRKIREYRGKLKWEGNLEQSRIGKGDVMNDWVNEAESRYQTWMRGEVKTISEEEVFKRLKNPDM